MNNLNSIFLSVIGVVAGGFIAIQSVLNSTLGQRVGNFGSVLVLTAVSALVLAALILAFPSSANFKALPGPGEWHLYFGGVLGVAILAAPIFLVPRIGTTSTLLLIVLGQALFALVIDNFGLFASPKIEITLSRAVGVALVAIGAYLVGR